MIRYTIAILTGLFICFTGYTQPILVSSVPEIVFMKFRWQYPQTQDTVSYPVTWAKDGDNYKASFVLNDAITYIILDSLGNLQKQVRRISPHKIPPKISDALKERFQEFNLLYILKIVDASGKETYQISLEALEFYTADGQRVKGKKEEGYPSISDSGKKKKK